MAAGGCLPVNGETDKAKLTGADGGPVLVKTALARQAALAPDELALVKQLLRRRAGVEDEDRDGDDDAA
jgi:hypothetical protein